MTIQLISCVDVFYVYDWVTFTGALGVGVAFLVFSGLMVPCQTQNVRFDCRRLFPLNDFVYFRPAFCCCCCYWVVVFCAGREQYESCLLAWLQFCYLHWLFSYFCGFCCRFDSGFLRAGFAFGLSVIIVLAGNNRNFALLAQNLAD